MCWEGGKGREGGPGGGEEGGLWIGSFILLPITINQLQVCTCYNPETCTPQEPFERAWKVSIM